MITESEMYWLTRLDHLHIIAVAISVTVVILSGIWLVVSSICHAVNHAEENTDLLPVSRKSLRWSIPCFLLSWVLIASAGFIPTTKEMCAIKAIPVIVNNEQVQELPNKVVELANEWIDELKPSENSK